MKTRVLAFLVVISILHVLLAGCTGNPGNASGNADAGQTPSDQGSAGPKTDDKKTDDQKPSNVRLKFFTGKIETIDVINDIINDFNASQSRITVEQEYQKDASNIIKIKFASGQEPDIMTTYEQGFVDEGKFLDLSDRSEWWDSLLPSMRDSCTDVKTGKQFRVCTNMTMAGYFYNKDIFNELGLTTASTWDEFTKNLKTIKEQKPDVTPWFIFGKEAWHLGHLIEFIPHGYIKQSLGAVEAKKAMLSNDKSKLNFGAADGAMAVFAQNMIGLKNEGLINSDVLTATSDNCVQDFVSGKAAMLSNGMWVLSGLLEANPDMENKIGFAPYPAYMPNSKPVVLSAEDSGYSISAATPYAEEAIEFLTFLFNAENQKKYSESCKAPSAFKAVNAEWAPAAIVNEVNSALNQAVNIGFTNEKPAGFSGDDMGRMLQDLLAGKYTPESFAAEYEKTWNEGMK